MTARARTTPPTRTPSSRWPTGPGAVCRFRKPFWAFRFMPAPRKYLTANWSSTHSAAFQPNCQNCGGALQPGHADASTLFEQENLPLPPPPPRAISSGYVWKLLLSDGFALAAGVFTLLGGIFSLVGIALTIGIITAFVGIPFALMGFLFLGAGGAVLYWRYQSAP